jgi:hypothetical protein
VCLLGHPNKLLASQALQLLLLATHPDMYDWHSQPGHSSSSSSSSSQDSQQQQQQAPQAAEAGTSKSQEIAASSSQQHTDSTASTAQQAAAAAAEQAVSPAGHPSQGPDGQLWLQLLALHDGPLLPRLLALSPHAWPGSGQQALQLLAFYLSWLRAWWSKVRGGTSSSSILQ